MAENPIDRELPNHDDGRLLTDPVVWASLITLAILVFLATAFGSMTMVQAELFVLAIVPTLVLREWVRSTTHDSAVVVDDEEDDADYVLDIREVHQPAIALLSDYS